MHPHEFVFSINADFLPSQYISLNPLFSLLPSLIRSSSISLVFFTSPTFQLYIFHVGSLTPCFCMCLNHLKRLSFIYFFIIATDISFFIFSFQIVSLKSFHSTFLIFWLIDIKMNHSFILLNFNDLGN